MIESQIEDERFVMNSDIYLVEKEIERIEVINVDLMKRIDQLDGNLSDDNEEETVNTLK